MRILLALFGFGAGHAVLQGDRCFFVFFFACFSLSACTNRPASQVHPQSPHWEDPFPIAFVERHAQTRQTHFNLDSIEVSRLQSIDSSFFLKWFHGRKLSNADSELKFEPQAAYFFLDYKEFEDKVLFSIIVLGGEWARRLIHFTYGNQEKVITDQVLVAVSGWWDGGYQGKEISTYNASGDLLTQVSVLQYDEDFDGGYTRRYDSSTCRFAFALNETSWTISKPVSRLDSIWSGGKSSRY